ncbi:MAG: alpha-glucan family phosphorylase [Candidatus Nanopelagicales bacterium]
MKAIRRLTVRTALPDPLSALDDLARNLRWSWHPETLDLFESIDPVLWAVNKPDPIGLLGRVSPDRLAELAEDSGFLNRLHAAKDDLDAYLSAPRWYQSLGADAPTSIAYFSPEFGIAAALPQYSGGLGILAGDHLKAASDLGVPLVGVGLLYRHGYFRQSLSRDGWQQEIYPLLDPAELAISALRHPDDRPVLVEVGLPGQRRLVARVWLAQVGRVSLLLLDSDNEDNTRDLRSVTDRLYGGGTEHRLMQEMLLGIGGVRALRAYCALTDHPAPEVFHTNEGHAGFLGLERIRELTEDEGLSFDEALEAARAGTVFTTHTPVPAGIDRFPRELVEQHFGGDNACPGVPVERIVALGGETYEGGDPGVFNMAVMGFRLAQRANGVAKLHGRVSRGMFNGLWAEFDADEVPITSITNGVHAPTWVAREIFDLARREVGPELVEEAKGWEGIAGVSEEDIWSTRNRLREQLVREVRVRLRQSWRDRGASDAELGWTDNVFDRDVLTIGFARRVPSYKRLTLMLRDPDRLRGLLLHAERPIQIVVAGKAHPADDGGKALIQQLVQFADREDVRHRIVFLPNYGIGMAQVLYPGCDVWLNNPLRPLEACGTSGMKSALNGGLNLSVLDGWWDEMFDGENGWAIPTADGVTDADRRDDLEAAALYELIEGQVTTRFYDRVDGAPPKRWLEMVRHTLQSLGPKVLASRMVRDYVQELYAPAALAARAVDGAGHARARALAAWKARVRADWHGVKVDHVETTGLPDSPERGQQMGVRSYVSLGSLTPDDVEVQVVLGRVDDHDTLTEPAISVLQPAESYEGGRWRFDGISELRRAGSFGFTVRVLPRHALLASGAELGLVAWPPQPEGMSEGDLR